MPNVISDRLRESAPKILALWEDRVRKELYTTFGKDFLGLRNSLPVYLTQLADALSDTIDRNPSRIAKDRAESIWVGNQHGRERANLKKYTIDQLIFEYHILRQTLFEVLEEEDELPKHARNIILDSIDHVTNQAVTQFTASVKKSHSLYENETLQNKEVQLQESELRFQRLVLSVNDYAIFMLDPNGIITTWNEGAEKLKGYEENEIIGKHFSIFYPKEDIDSRKPERELREATTLGRYEEEGWRLRKDGSRFWANVVIGQVRDEYGNHIGFSKVTRDLTERKRIEDKLKQSHEDLEKRVEERTAELREALQSRDEFLSIASHELKTPLTSLSLQLQMLGRSMRKVSWTDHLSPEKMRLSIESCEKQSKRLAMLLDELLDLTKIRVGKLDLNKERFDICQMVHEHVNHFKAEKGKINFLVSVTTCGPTFGQWDRIRIEQIITNLLSNALKYGEGKPIEISVNADSTRVSLSIKDQGIGIPLNMQKKIFERFERAVNSKSISGLGLGLYIVRQIVEAHGGSIEVQSESAKGSLFTVQIPLESPTA